MNGFEEHAPPAVLDRPPTMSPPAGLPVFRWRTFFVAAAITFAAVACLWIAAPPRYLTNDDVAIRLGLEGRAVPGQPPTGFVLMTHAALGWTVVALQKWIPGAPIWDLIVGGTLAWAIAVLGTLTWTALGSSGFARATALVALMVPVIPVFAGVQFTISSTLAGGAAVLLAVTELALPSPRRAVLGMAALLLATGMLVRPMGAAAGAVAVGLALAPSALSLTSDSRRRLVQLAFVLAITVVLFAALVYADGVLYAVDADWQAYYRYNWMVAQLFEWGGELPQDDIAAIRASVGWSTNDWAMLQRWFGVDPALHGVEKISAAYEARTAAMGWDEWLRWASNRLGSIDRSTVRELAGDGAFVFIAIGLLTAVYATWRGAVAAAASVLLFLGLYTAIQVAFKELPFRLLAPLLACTLAAALTGVGWLRRPVTPAMSILGLAGVLALATQQAATLAEADAADRRHRSQVEGEVAELHRLPHSLIVIHADAFPSEHWWRPFVRPSVTLDAISLAGNNQSPLLQRFLSSTARQPLFRAICEDPSILVISEPDRLDLVTTYFREHFNVAIRWHAMFEGSFRAWRCAIAATSPKAAPPTETTE